jgi:cytochrome c553
MMVESKADAQDIAAYYAKQKRMKGVPAEGDAAKLAEKGKALYSKLTCDTCHGESGQGKGSLFPVVGGQHKDYLVKTLQDLRSGERENDKTNMMAPLAKNMSDEQIEAVAEYMSSL